MLCIEMPEVAYLYGYLLVSARVYMPDSTPTSCRSDTPDIKPCILFYKAQTRYE